MSDHGGSGDHGGHGGSGDMGDYDGGHDGFDGHYDGGVSLGGMGGCKQHGHEEQHHRVFSNLLGLPRKRRAVNRCCVGYRQAFEFGYLGHALENLGRGQCPHPKPEVEKAKDDCPARSMRLPGLIANGNKLQILVWPHGRCDTKKLFEAVAKDCGLINIGWRKSGLSPIDNVKNQITDTLPFDTGEESKMPSGWSPGATGHTRIWRDFYQVGEKKYFWSKFDANLTRRTHLIVSGATWYFDGYHDFETRISMSVKIVKYWEGMKWCMYTDEVEKHVRAGGEAGEHFFSQLKLCLPTEFSVLARQVQAIEKEVALRKMNEAAVANLAANAASPSELPAKKIILNAGAVLGPDPIDIELQCNGD